MPEENLYSHYRLYKPITDGKKFNTDHKHTQWSQRVWSKQTNQSVSIDKLAWFITSVDGIGTSMIINRGQKCWAERLCCEWYESTGLHPSRISDVNDCCVWQAGAGELESHRDGEFTSTSLIWASSGVLPVINNTFTSRETEMFTAEERTVPIAHVQGERSKHVILLRNTIHFCTQRW